MKLRPCPDPGPDNTNTVGYETGGEYFSDDVVFCTWGTRDCVVPIWIKPNAGTPEIVDGQTVFQATPADFSRHAPALLEAGARFVGGCCGTGPEFIKALKAEIHV